MRRQAQRTRDRETWKGMKQMHPEARGALKKAIKNSRRGPGRTCAICQ